MPCFPRAQQLFGACTSLVKMPLTNFPHFRICTFLRHIKNRSTALYTSIWVRHLLLHMLLLPRQNCRRKGKRGFTGHATWEPQRHERRSTTGCHCSSPWRILFFLNNHPATARYYIRHSFFASTLSWFPLFGPNHHSTITNGITLQACCLPPCHDV